MVLSGLLCYRYASIIFGEEGFAEYALLRRTISFISPIIFLGLQVALTRYLSKACVGKSRSEVQNVFVTGLLILLTTLILVASLLLIFKGYAAFLFFSDIKYSFLIAPIVVFLAGSALHTITYSYFRGVFRMSGANMLQFLNLGIGNLAGFFFFDNIVSVIYFAGIFWISTSLLTLLYVLWGFSLKKFKFKQNFIPLFTYGLQRVPGDFLLAGLFALPSYLTAHYFSVTTGGYVAFGVSILNMAGTAFYPVSLILLPQATRMLSDNRISELKVYWNKIFLWATIISIGGLVIFQIFATPLLNLYLGEIKENMLVIVRLIAIAFPAYMIYVALRSLNDAYYFISVNSINLAIIFVIYLVLFFVFHLNLLLSLYCFVFTLYLLMVLTLIFNLRIFKRNNLITKIS